MDELIEVLTHASIRIGGDCVIYADPFRVAETKRDGDIILITHEHFDHYSPEDIAKVAKENTIIVAPKTMEKQVGEGIFLTAGESIELKGVTIEAVAAYNVLKPFHAKGKGWLGYIITINGTRIYIAGDTDENPDNQKVACDIALVPVGGTYTMDAKAAAKFVNRMKPQIAIPIHYGSVAGNAEDGETFAGLVTKGIAVKIKM